MLIQEFEKTYCSDIMKDVNKKKSKLIDWTTLPYQEMYENEDGKMIPVVWVDNVPIYNRDFLEMTRDEFVYAHNTPNAGEFFDRYTEDFEFREGTDILTYYQKRAREETQRIKEEAEIAASLCE